MIIFEEGQAREITRKRALGLKKIIISDDVERGDEVEMQATGDELVIFRKDEQEIPDGEEPVYTFITKEFGLYGASKGFKSLIELKMCDDVMIVNLIAGSIVIRPEGNLMKASRAVGQAQLPPCNSEDILWVDVEKLLGYLGHFAKYSGKYPYDYEYYLEIGGSYDNKLESFTIKKHCDAVDISCGALAIKEEEDLRKADAKEARKMAQMFMNINRQGEEIEDDSSDDDDDDDDYVEY